MNLAASFAERAASDPNSAEAWAVQLGRMVEGLPAREWDPILIEAIEKAERRGALGPVTAAYLAEFYDLPR